MINETLWTWQFKNNEGFIIEVESDLKNLDLDRKKSLEKLTGLKNKVFYSEITKGQRDMRIYYNEKIYVGTERLVGKRKIRAVRTNE